MILTVDISTIKKTGKGRLTLRVDLF